MSISVIAAFAFDGGLTTSDSLRDFVRHTVGNVRHVAGVLRAAPAHWRAVARV